MAKSKLHDHPSSYQETDADKQPGSDAKVQKMGEGSQGSRGNEDAQPETSPEALYAAQSDARKSMVKRHATERLDMQGNHADEIRKMNSRHETEHKDMAGQHLDAQAEKYNADVDAQNATFAPAAPTSPTNTADDPTRYSRGR